MNLKLCEWNEACAHAQKECEYLTIKGYLTKSNPYILSDGSKGINMVIFDDAGNKFAEYSTGSHNNLTDLKDAIDKLSKRIENEI